MDNGVFQDWVMEADTTPEQISRARVIVDFLAWAADERGRSETHLNEYGYDFRRSVSICGSHEYEIVEDDELAELVIRFLKEDQ